MIDTLQKLVAGGAVPQGVVPTLLTVIGLQTMAIILLLLRVRRHRRAEAVLRGAEGQSRHIVASSPIGICVVRNRRFVYVNRAYVKMFGYGGPEEIVGRFVEELYTPEERKRQRQFAKDRPAGKPVPQTYTTKGLRKDGSHFDVVAWVSLIDYEGVPSSLGFVIDRTVEQQLRRRLENANRLEAIGTLAGGIAHDFNNILTAILGYTELALLKVDRGSEVGDNLQHVRLAGRRAKELVQQILTFSSGREGQPQLVCFASLVREVMGLLRASLPSTIEVRTFLNNESLVYGDPSQIHQLLMNLCANAEYAMRGGKGVLEVSLSTCQVTGELNGPHPDFEPGEYLCLTVADTGHGIPEEMVEKVFEPFFTTKERGEGTGMGLPQVHGIVRRHHGHIQVEGNQPKGTRFVMFFPIVGDGQGEATLQERDIQGGSEAILVVDDEEMVSQVTAQTLTELGYLVEVCRSGRDALAMVRAEPERFALVLSDVTMPGMTGEELAEAMRTLRPDLSVILCSGCCSLLDEAKLSRLGVRAFLAKPVGKNQLARTVRNVLDEAISRPAVRPELGCLVD